MYTHARRTGLLFAGLLAPLAAHAMDVTVADLPGSIQSCVANASCIANTTSVYDSATASAFAITDASQPGYLIRYALAVPSGQDITSLTPPSTPYSGYLWMQVQSFYSASQAADPITLYLDKVSPAPATIYKSGDLTLYVSPADLLAGSSYVKSGLDSNNNGYVSGSLSGDVPIGCVAQGCSAFAQINLAQLQFGQYGSTIYSTGFNPADTHTLVFSQGTADDGSVSGYPYSATQSFYVSAVPEPQFVCLYSSGLACLAAVLRRKRITGRWRLRFSHLLEARRAGACFACPPT